MVKKRRQRVKPINNDSDGSDTDEYYESPDEISTPSQRYSLRKRTRPIIPAGFEVDEDENPINSDGDFNAEEVIISPHNSPKKKRTPITNKSKIDSSKINCTITSITPLELEPELPEGQSIDGMIDFEDIIRADILVNRNKIDYDNVIEKTEIKLETSKPIEQLIEKSNILNYIEDEKSNDINLVDDGFINSPTV